MNKTHYFARKIENQIRTWANKQTQPGGYSIVHTKLFETWIDTLVASPLCDGDDRKKLNEALRLIEEVVNNDHE